MSTHRKKEPPPYIVPGQGNRVNIYHTPFTPSPALQDSVSPVTPVENQEDGMHIYYAPFNPPPSSHDSMSQVPPVYTSGGGAVGSGLDSEDGKRKFVSYDTVLGNCPGMTTCFSCQQQVMTNITHKAGTYAWLMCTLFIILGLTMCLVPFCLFIVWKQTKDVYHTCPLCNRVLHVERKKCCK